MNEVRHFKRKEREKQKWEKIIKTKPSLQRKN